jgi:hypothetical protein
MKHAHAVRRNPRPPKLVPMVALVSALLLSGLIAQELRPFRPGGPAVRVRATVAQPGPILGVYRGAAPSEVAAFGRWLGRPPRYVLDFARRHTWAQIADPSRYLEDWAGSSYRLVFSVPMLPEAGHPPDPTHDSMAAGARGAYDAHFARLAKNLIALGHPDAVLRIGWEFNLGHSRWAVDDPTVFIQYWRHIVTAMRSVPGSRFEFDWNVNNGDTRNDAAEYFPGAAYADYVGVDIYDASWQQQTYPYPRDCKRSCVARRQRTAWKHNYSAERGLAFWSRFARSKGIPLSLPEWGAWERADGHGGGDNPYFIRRMHDFIQDPANGVAYQIYFNFDGSDGRHRLPNAAAEYRRLFGS